MKVSCLQENLQRALGRVSRAVATRTTLPVLSNVWIGTEDGRLKIAATNMEIGVTTWIDASVEDEGQITVDARLLSEFVNTLPTGEVKLDLDPNRLSLTVRAGRDKAAINGIDPEDFPVITTMKEGNFTISIDAQTLRDRISLVEFAAATDESRPVLAGVLTRFDGDNMMLAAADGFRMAVSEGPSGVSVPERQDVIVPARSYRELARLVADYDEEITISVAGNKAQIIARFGDTEWVSQLIDGTFPDVKQIVPREFATRVDVGRDTLLNAVRRASYFARENNDVIRLAIHAGEDDMTPGSVEVTANAAERGNSESFVDASIAGGELQIAFNSRYLSDVLGVLKHGNIMLGLNGANQAGVVRPSGAENYSHVIMPMVIGGQ
ncbi:MAG TPA: DNA polymerase III subunit beta [Thermomicrobiales bacterium]|nr:DNA polymerase III subunit beta [Thermomicrobiales bacterium]